MDKLAFKIEVEDDSGIWSDVLAADGSVVTYASEDAARAGLAIRYPEAAGLEKAGGVKKTRVVRVFRTDEEWEN
jgi:hypothetical protein